MPAYAGTGKAKLLYENRQAFLFQNESIAAGTASIAVQLRRERGAHYPWGAAFELAFAGDPGAFEFEIQGAEIDQNSNYVKLGSITTVNGTYVGRYDMPPTVFPKFVRAYPKTLTNAVNTTLVVTR